MALLLAMPGPAWAGPPLGVDAPPERWDFDGDGRSDVLAVRRSPPNVGLVRLLLGDSVSSFDGIRHPALIHSEFDVVGAGILLGAPDGRAALLVERRVGSAVGLVRIYELDASASAPLQSHFLPLDLDTTTVGIADFDGNASDDILHVFTSGGGRGLVRATLLKPGPNPRIKSVFPVVLPDTMRILASGDLDGDGLADLLAVKIAPPNTGLLRVFLLGATGTGPDTEVFVRDTAFVGFRNPDYEFVGLADLRHDGRLDLVTQKREAPNAGLIRVRTFSADARALDGVFFPALLDDARWQLEGLGNYDGTHGADLLARRIGGPNEGLFRIWSFESDGETVRATGFPRTRLALDWEILPDRLEHAP